MRSVKILILLAFVVTMASAKDATGTKGSYKVLPVSALKTVSYNSVVYALPKTELEIEVTAQKTTKLRGPFYQYSERYLGLKDVITENETNWELVDVTMETSGIPDDDKKFAIQFFGSSVAPFLSYSENGCIAAVNAAGDAMEKHIEIEKILDLGSNEASFDFVPYTEEMLIANSTAKMAEEAAAYIKRIRENRTLLISGEAATTPADGEAFALALKKMDELERQFIELFRGKVVIEVVHQNISFLPTKEMERELLFRFSKFKGVVEKNDLSGEPVTLALKLIEQTDLPNEPQEAEYDDKGKLIRKAPDAGFYYNLPKSAMVSLSYAGKAVYSNRFAFGQFGQVLNLPTTIPADANTTLLFNTVTGAIQSIQK